MVAYMGGKHRQSKPFAEAINKFITPGDAVYWEPFCGMCSVGARIKHPTRVFSDNNKYLIAMHQALADGWVPPDEISPKEWHRVKDNPDENPALTGFVGFGCSFGGIFFIGYARYSKKLTDKGYTFAKSAHNSSLKLSRKLKGSQFLLRDYRDSARPMHAVIYADPPYEGTAGYNGAEFDHEEFWGVMEGWSLNNKVFVSGYELRPGWEPIVTLTPNVQLSSRKPGTPLTRRPEYLLMRSNT